jgi:hypothetical protein
LIIALFFSTTLLAQSTEKIILSGTDAGYSIQFRLG